MNPKITAFVVDYAAARRAPGVTAPGESASDAADGTDGSDGALTSRGILWEPANGCTNPLQGGGAVAVGDLYRDLHAIMFAYARRCLRDEKAAEDVVQDSFERFLKAEKSLRSRAPEVMRAYLFTILRNRIAEPRRPTVAFDEEMGQIEAEVEAEASSPSASTTPEDLRQAIELLPEPLRTPLVLFHFQRLSHKQIADHMRITALAVAMRLFKARRKLRTILFAVLARRGADFEDPQRAARKRSTRGEP